MKAGLPQHGVVEQALDENHFRIGSGLLPIHTSRPCRPARNDEAALTPNAAAIEIAFQRKDDAMQ